MIDYYRISPFDFALAGEESDMAAKAGGQWVPRAEILSQMLETRFNRRPVRVRLVARSAEATFQFSSRGEAEDFCLRWRLHELRNSPIRRLGRIVRRLLWSVGLAKL